MLPFSHCRICNFSYMEVVLSVGRLNFSEVVWRLTVNQTSEQCSYLIILSYLYLVSNWMSFVWLRAAVLHDPHPLMFLGPFLEAVLGLNSWVYC